MECLALNPNCSGGRMLLEVQWSMMGWRRIFSKILAKVLRSEMGR